MDRLDGRIAVITGTADGIGRGIALACADAGMKPVLADLDTDRLAATAAELDGAEVLAVPTDVRRAQQVEAPRVGGRCGVRHRPPGLRQRGRRHARVPVGDGPAWSGPRSTTG
jgi:Mg-chelatase subunit ChlI